MKLNNYCGCCLHSQQDITLGLFDFGSKKINSVEYEKLSKRLTDAESDIDKLTSKFMSLRGLVHRKFTGEIPIEEAKETGHIEDGFDELRKLNKEKDSKYI